MKTNLIIFLTNFLLVAVLETVINQLLLQDTYQSLQSLWRSPEDLKSMAPLFLLIYTVHSFGFTMIMKLSEANLDWKKGFWIGVCLGLISRFWYAYTNFIVLPIPNSLAMQWFAYGVLELSIMGVVTGAIVQRLRLKK